jgi:hypothetical protein
MAKSNTAKGQSVVVQFCQWIAYNVKSVRFTGDEQPTLKDYVAAGLVCMLFIGGVSAAGYIFLIFFVFAAFGVRSLYPSDVPELTPIWRVGLYLAIGMLPHVIFLCIYNYSYDQRAIDQELLPSALHNVTDPPHFHRIVAFYEKAVGALHSAVEPFNNALWMGLLALVVATVLIPLIPSAFLTGYLRFKNALSIVALVALVALVAASFTVFSGQRQGYWEPNARVRLEAQLVREGKKRTELLLIEAISRELRATHGMPPALEPMFNELFKYEREFANGQDLLLFVIGSTEIANVAERIANSTGTVYGGHLVSLMPKADIRGQTPRPQPKRISLSEAWEIAGEVQSRQEDIESLDRTIRSSIASLAGDLGGAIVGFGTEIVPLRKLVTEFWAGVLAEVASNAAESLYERFGPAQAVQQLREHEVSVSVFDDIETRMLTGTSTNESRGIVQDIVNEIPRITGEERSKMRRSVAKGEEKRDKIAF